MRLNYVAQRVVTAARLSAPAAALTHRAFWHTGSASGQELTPSTSTNLFLQNATFFQLMSFEDHVGHQIKVLNPCALGHLVSLIAG